MHKAREDFMVKAEMEKTLKKEEELKKDKEVRSIKRKPDIPKANRKNFEEENVRMGVQTELDLLMTETADK
jgi:hypothetical protein